MTRRITAWPILSALAVLLLAACSSSSGTAAPTTAPTSAPTSAPVSEAPSAAESAAPSIAIPSFVLPNDDKGLEALLPGQLCGQAATKLSASGTRFQQYETPTEKAALEQLGKTPADVVFAIALPNLAGTSTCDTSAFIYRIKGADPDKFKALFIALAKQEENTTYTQGNVGGKAVYIGTTPGGKTKTYAYFNGDALFAVSAPDDATAAPALQAMP